jgi:hypothetical protein
MNTMNTKLISAAVFFLLIILSGFWLSRTGKPYSTLILTIHKLIGVGVGIYLISTVYRIYKAGSISPIGLAAIVVTILFFVGLVATGGLLSTEKPMPVFISAIHKLLPYLTVLSSGTTLYLLL